MIIGKNILYNYLPIALVGCVLLGLIIYLRNSVPVTLYDREALPSYSTNLRYEPIDVIDLDNQTGEPCSPSKTKLCNVDDRFSCLGCKSGMAICTRVTQDLDYIDDETGERKVLKPNSETNEKEGYCLPIQNLAQNCNPYHGHFALTKLNPEDEVMFITCECDRPGIIGKDTFLGDCINSYICPIKDINKPFEKLECECAGGSKPQFDEMPICVYPNLTSSDFTIEEMQIALPNQFNRVPFIDTALFNESISSVVKVKKLPSPCNYCPITGEYINGRVSHFIVEEKEEYVTCEHVDDQTSVIPHRLDPKGRILKGPAGPDILIKARWEERAFFFGLSTGLVIYKLLKEKNTKLFEKLNITSTYGYVHCRGEDYRFFRNLKPAYDTYNTGYTWTDATIFTWWGWYYNMDKADHYVWEQRKTEPDRFPKSRVDNKAENFMLFRQRHDVNHVMFKDKRKERERKSYIWSKFDVLYLAPESVENGHVGLLEYADKTVNGERPIPFITVTEIDEYKDKIVYPGKFDKGK